MQLQAVTNTDACYCVL